MKYFDHFAKSKSTNIGNFFSNKKVLNEYNLINKFIKHKDVEILEIGPGKGNLAKLFLNNNFINYDIVEPNSYMRETLENYGIRNAKSYMIPYLKEEANTYDFIIICDVFEHLNDAKEAQIFISEVKRVLKNGGYIYIFSPDLLDWEIDFWNCDFSHSNPTTVRRTIQLFYNNDISPVYWHYSYSCFNGVLGKFISSAIKLLTYFSKGNSLDSKFYKLRLTFLRRFAIIGVK